MGLWLKLTRILQNFSCYYYAPGLKGPPEASSVWIVCLSVRLSVCLSVIPSRLCTKCNI